MKIQSLIFLVQPGSSEKVCLLCYTQGWILKFFHTTSENNACSPKAGHHQYQFDDTHTPERNFDLYTAPPCNRKG